MKEKNNVYETIMATASFLLLIIAGFVYLYFDGGRQFNPILIWIMGGIDAVLFGLALLIKAEHPLLAIPQALWMAIVDKIKKHD